MRRDLVLGHGPQNVRRVRLRHVQALDGRVFGWASSRTKNLKSPEHPRFGHYRAWQNAHFCPECGSSIWHRPKVGKTPTLGQGLFDDQAGWTRSREIFVDNKPDHYAFGAPAKALTGAATIIAYLLGRLPK